MSALTGKGVFITHDAIGEARASEWADLAACGLQWVALQVAWHRSAGVRPVRPEWTRQPGRLVDETYAATRRGVGVWWWGWPVPSRVGEWLRLAEDSVVAAAGTPLPGGTSLPAGWILNLETAEPGGRRAWAEGSEAAARELVAGMRSIWQGPILVTSHGRLTRRQPWRVLGALDGALPQAYDPDCGYGQGGDGSTYASRCADSYRDVFGSRVALLLGANSTTPDCMARLAEDAAAVTDGALAWWSWTTLRTSAARRAVVAATRLPAGA